MPFEDSLEQIVSYHRQEAQRVTQTILAAVAHFQRQVDVTLLPTLQLCLMQMQRWDLFGDVRSVPIPEGAYVQFSYHAPHETRIAFWVNRSTGVAGVSTGRALHQPAHRWTHARLTPEQLESRTWLEEFVLASIRTDLAVDHDITSNALFRSSRENMPANVVGREESQDETDTFGEVDEELDRLLVQEEVTEDLTPPGSLWLRIRDDWQL